MEFNKTEYCRSCKIFLSHKERCPKMVHPSSCILACTTRPRARIPSKLTRNRDFETRVLRNFVRPSPEFCLKFCPKFNRPLPKLYPKFCPTFALILSEILSDLCPSFVLHFAHLCPDLVSNFSPIRKPKNLKSSGFLKNSLTSND